MPASREGAGMVRGFEPPGFLRTRECRRVEATCASWPNVAHDLGGSGIAGDRCCPLDLVIRGPDVAPRARAWKARTGRRADEGTRPARGRSSGTAVDRGRPFRTAATGTSGARPASMNVAPAGQQRYELACTVRTGQGG